MSQCRLCGGEILDRSDSRYCVYCNSTFHRGCIIDHFYRNKYCPVCNKKMSLIFMRYGEPPEPAVKKRPIPKEIRKPKWPHLERRTEVPVFDADIPAGPLKRTDKYIPKPRGRRGMPKLPKKLPGKKIPTKVLAVILVAAVAVVAVYFGRDYLPTGVSEPEGEPESPWKVVWTYSLEGVQDIAASDYGIAVGGRNGLVILDSEGKLLWREEGEISAVDMKDDVIAASNQGVIVIYNISGDELARYGEGTADSVSLSVFGILAAGLSDGGIALLGITGEVYDEYSTEAVGSVSISPDGAMTAYRAGGIVYVLDVLGEVRYAFEDGGSQNSQIIITSSGWVFAHTGNEVFLYNGEDVVWSAPANGCEAGLAVSRDETQFAVNASTAQVYSVDGELLFELPAGSCGSIAFSGSDVIVSDSSSVYYLRLEEVEEEEVEEEEEPEESAEPTEAEAGELGSYEDWFTWYQSFLSQPGNSAVYAFTVEEEGEISQQMEVQHTIEELDGDNVTETITMIIETVEQELRTSFKRWINAAGVCVKAEMTIDQNVTSLECGESNIRGIDLRYLPSHDQFEYLGTEEITVERGTFLCHKLQVETSSGTMTLWITDGLPPIQITLQQDTTVITAELT